MPRSNPETEAIQKNIQIKKFAKAYIENGGNGLQAMLKTKPVTSHSAGTIAYRWLKKDEVRKAISDALQAHEVDPTWIVAQRKEIINEGVKQIKNGFQSIAKVGTNKDGSDTVHSVQVTPSDVDKHLNGIERLLTVLDSGSGNTNPNTSKHLHLHLDAENVGEIIDQRNASKSFFDDVLGTKDLDSTEVLKPTSSE